MLFAEYGSENHYLFVDIWNNVDNRDLIRKAGERINELGGLQAMQANYYTLLDVFRNLYKDELDDPHVGIAWDIMRCLINGAWNGVGEWQM